MAVNRDESPLIIAHGSPFVDRSHTRKFLCLCCYDAIDEFLSWGEKLKGFLRRGKECSANKWGNILKKLKKTNSGVTYSNSQTKSGRFQYDPFDYALNFDNGCGDDDEYSLRAFSARFACPIAKPRELKVTKLDLSHIEEGKRKHIYILTNSISSLNFS